MYDIKFFQKCNDVKERIIDRDISIDSAEIYSLFENFRSKLPFVFNIETTNACNMRCIMCPRTELMNRPISHMDMGLFEKIITQINTNKQNELHDFWKFVAAKYGNQAQDRNENSFYFYTVSKSLVMHGYGEPLLDPYIAERVALCSKYDIPTYFSCVPANIDLEKVTTIMRAGLGTIKFAMDSLDDESEKKTRGEKSNFTESYKKICDLIEIKSKNPSIKTNIVITMLELSQKRENSKLFKDFINLWRDKPVYAYVKSQDNRWLYEETPELESKSHYKSQYCEFPWMSMTVMTDGSVVPCTQDYNAEIVLGNANSQSLDQIWNSSAYDNFRKWHINGAFPKNYKCNNRCDLKVVWDKLKEKETRVI